jgi:hypothetical protein
MDKEELSDKCWGNIFAITWFNWNEIRVSQNKDKAKKFLKVAGNLFIPEALHFLGLLCNHTNFGDIQTGLYYLKSAASFGYIDLKYDHFKLRKAVGSGKNCGWFYNFKIAAESWNHKAEFHYARCFESDHKIENLEEPN